MEKAGNRLGHVNLLQSAMKYTPAASTHHNSGLGSSVGLVTDYGLDGRGSNPGGDEIFRLSRLAPGPTQPPVKWVLGLSRG